MFAFRFAPAIGTKTEAFVEAVILPVDIPLSGRTMSFDADGTCVEGC
jgi:hypothetical protein